jgi:hypothetical protein
VSQTDEEDSKAQNGGHEHESAGMMVGERACRWIVGLVFCAAPSQADKEGDHADEKRRHAEREAEQRMSQTIVDVEEIGRSDRKP